MKLENSFEVAAPPERVWAFLMDPALVVPCMPGAELREIIDADNWKAGAKVKLGPVTMNFRGAIAVVERDDAEHRVVMTAKGTETRGKGMFKATITSSLEPRGEGVKVSVVTDVKLSGKAASFSRGMIGDISARLTRQFADNVQHQLNALAEQTEQADEATPESGEVEESGAPEESGDSPDGASAPSDAGATKTRPTGTRPAPPPPPPNNDAIGGFGMFAWALWRAAVRLLGRVVKWALRRVAVWKLKRATRRERQDGL